MPGKRLLLYSHTLRVCSLAAVVLLWQSCVAGTENWFAKPKAFTDSLQRTMATLSWKQIFQSRMAWLFSCWWIRTLNIGECSGQDGDRWREGYSDFQMRSFYLAAVTCLGCMPASSAPWQLFRVPLVRTTTSEGHVVYKSFWGEKSLPPLSASIKGMKFSVSASLSLQPQCWLSLHKKSSSVMWAKKRGFYWLSC